MEEKLEIRDGILRRGVLTKREVIVPEGVRVIGEGAFQDPDGAELSPSIFKSPYPADPSGKPERIVLPAGVREIRRRAFRYCRRLREVVLPDSLELLHEEAFADCSFLESVRIPPRVTVLPERLFQGCWSLTTLELPAGLKTIGREALSGCRRLRSLHLPAGLERVGEGAFAGCETLESVRIPDGVVALPSRVFADCSFLERAELPGSLRVIAGDAFASCQELRRLRVLPGNPELSLEFLEKLKLERLSMPGISILRLPTESLRHAGLLGLADWSLEHHTLPEDLEADVRSYLSAHLPAFLDEAGTDLSLLRYLAQLRVLTRESAESLLRRAQNRENTDAIAILLGYLSALPEADSTRRTSELMRELETGYLSADAFDASWIARRDGPEGLTLVEYHGTHRGELVVPAGREQEPVVALAQDLFRDRDDITSVIVPEGVRRMDLWAFADSRSIRRVELPSTLEEIPPYAFARCAALEEVRLAPGIRALRASAFLECSHLTDLIVPEGVEVIEKQALAGCSSLAHLSLPASLNAIHEEVFRGCEALVRLEVAPGNPEFRAEGPFLLSPDRAVLRHAVPSLQGDVRVPEGVEEIADQAFLGCWQMARLQIPGSVRRIGAHAFQGCRELRYVNMEDGVETIGEGAFENCRSLDMLILPGTIRRVEENLCKDCKGLLSVTLRDGIEEIGPSAFRNCERLLAAYLDPSVKKIGESAFRGCRMLASVSSENGLEEIGHRAFENCRNLVTIELLRLQRLDVTAFRHCAGLRSLRLPATARVLYPEDEGQGLCDGCVSLTRVEVDPDNPWYRSEGPFLLSKDGTVLLRAMPVATTGSVVLPDSVREIRPRAFADCERMASLTIPAGVTTLDMIAFGYCRNLQSLTFLGAPEHVADFVGICDPIELHVPEQIPVGEFLSMVEDRVVLGSTVLCD